MISTFHNLPTANPERSIPLIVRAFGSGRSGFSGRRLLMSGSNRVSGEGSCDVTYTYCIIKLANYKKV